MTGSSSPTTAPAPDRSRRVYVWWAVGFAFLGLLGLLCLLVARPVVEVRRASEGLLAAPMAGYFPERESVEAAVAGLGGPEQAARKIGLYLRMPERLVGDYQWTAGAILGCCGKPGLRKLRELLADPPGSRYRYGYWGAMAFDWYYRGSPADWNADAALKTAAEDSDPETARLAGEMARILSSAGPPKLQPSPGPVMSVSPPR